MKKSSTAQVEILDCTLRDASYAIAYQFTAEDTAVIAAGLEDAGFTQIEIGHGLGLGASRAEYGFAAATDEQYLDAASRVLKVKSRLGAFLIPGIADLSHIDLLAKYGAGFVRVGTNVTQTEQMESFIKHAKKLGMKVFANLMKTYAVSADDVSKRATAIEDWGADGICVVDSAGCMLPDEVSAYVRMLKAKVKIQIGFHGHNNLQLAVANSMAAIQAGATVVDGTLRGLGRSSGNAQTEVLVMALKRLGYETGINSFKTMDLAEKTIAPFAQGRGVDSIEIVSGYSMFHSSFLKTVERVAIQTEVDLRELIMRVSEANKLSVSETLAREVAEKIRSERKTETEQHHETPPANAEILSPFVNKKNELSSNEMAHQIALEIKTLSKKTDRVSVFTIAYSTSQGDPTPVFPFIRWNETNVIGTVEVSSAEQAVEIAKSIDGHVDYVLVDEHAFASQDNLLDAVAATAKKSKVFAYRDLNAHLDAAEAFISRLRPTLNSSNIAICGSSGFGLRLAQRLSDCGASIHLWDENEARAQQTLRCLSAWGELTERRERSSVISHDSDLRKVDLVVGASIRKPSVPLWMIQRLRDGALLLDAGVGSITEDGMAEAVTRKLKTYRLDVRAGLSGQIAVSLETLDLFARVIGQSEVGNIEIIAGGVIGKQGAVVVDAISSPTKVIGVANGKGHLLPEAELGPFRDTMAKVRLDILRNRLPASQRNLF